MFIDVVLGTFEFVRFWPFSAAWTNFLLFSIDIDHFISIYSTSPCRQLQFDVRFDMGLIKLNFGHFWPFYGQFGPFRTEFGHFFRII